MAIEISSTEINKVDEKKRIQYLLNEVFKSKYVVGRIDNITTSGDGFVTLCVANKLNEIYKIDNRKWDVYFNLNNVEKNIKENLNKGDLVYFKPIINTKRPEQVIQINSKTIKKLIEYNEFLREADIDLNSVLLEGDLVLEKEDDIKLWATKEFYKGLKELHKDLLYQVDSTKLELNELNEEKKKIEEKMNSREVEIQNKQEEMEKLANKLSYFGFKTFKKEKVKNEVHSEDISDEALEIFEYIKTYIRNNEKLIYSDDIIRRFLVALQSKELIILSGPSGTGKTSLVTAISKAVGAEAKIIPVKPSWTDTEDLVGFYNPIERTYISTPFLDALIEAKREKNSNKLYLICLDEMNLSHVEYYFAEFLSKLEVNDLNPSIELYSKEVYDEILEEISDTINLISGQSIHPISEELAKWCGDNEKDYAKEITNLKKKINFVEKYPAVFEIPKNVRFIGTMNVDQTTKQISPKVIDRSFVIELLKYKIEEIQENESYPIDNKFVSVSAFEMKNNELSKFDNEVIKELEDINNNYLEILNSDFNNRTMKHIKKYLLNLSNYKLNLDKETVISDIIYMKILPRINTSFKNKNDEKYTKWNEFNQKLSLESANDIKIKLDKMNNFAKEDNILSFWGVY